MSDTTPKPPNLNVPMDSELNAMLMQVFAAKQASSPKRLSIAEVIRQLIREAHKEISA